MKNADKPISPCMMQQVGENEYRANKPNDEKMYNVPCEGLTKREYFAGLAMQGILANQFIAEYKQELNIEQAAVRFADDLLKELEKQQP